MIICSYSIEFLPEPLHPFEHCLSPALTALGAHFRVELLSLAREPLRELHIPATPRIRRPCEASIARGGELSWALAVRLVRLAAHVLRCR